MWEVAKSLICLIVMFVLCLLAFNKVEEVGNETAKEKVKVLEQDVEIYKYVFSVVPWSDEEKQVILKVTKKTYPSLNIEEWMKILNVKVEEIKNNEEVKE